MGRRERRGERLVFGQNACRALYTRHPNDIRRVWVVENDMHPFGDILKHCAANRWPYHITDREELSRVTDSLHHEGIAILAEIDRVELAPLLEEEGPCTVVALGGVANPHNLGAILRSCAHFGVKAVLVEAGKATLGGAAHRTAEGGAEWVDVIETEDLEETLETMQESGFRIIATTSRSENSMYEAKYGARCVLLLGSERDGLSEALLGLADAVVAVPGTGNVESLNVSASCAVLLAEMARPRTPKVAAPRGRKGGPRGRQDPRSGRLKS